MKPQMSLRRCQPISNDPRFLTGEGVRVGGGFHTYPTTIRALPIPAPEVMRENAVKEIEKLSRRLSDTQGQLGKETSPAKHEQFVQRFTADDARLDHLVYGLYGLSKDEIESIEGVIR
jgi:hypothetical protein